MCGIMGHEAFICLYLPVDSTISMEKFPHTPWYTMNSSMISKTPDTLHIKWTHPSLQKQLIATGRLICFWERATFYYTFLVRWDTHKEICIPVISVINHSKERITSHNTFLSMVRKNSSATSAANAIVETVNWKSTNSVTTEKYGSPLVEIFWRVYIAPKCLLVIQL